MSVLRAPTTRLTVAEYEELGRAGFFGPEERVELLNGQIIPMSPIGIRHAVAVRRLNRFFARHAPGRFDINPQNPFNLNPYSQPEPDLALIDLACDAPPRHPTPADIFLLIEVSDSTLPYDRKDKGPAYADQRIREYWILNLDENCLEVYRDPQPNGYADRRVLGPNETLAPLAFPDVLLRVGDFLP